MARQKYLRRYLEKILLGRDVTRAHAKSYRHRLKQYNKFLGREAVLSDLDTDTLNAWVAHLKRSGGYAPKTVKHFRDAVLFVWREAWEQREVEVGPWRIRNVKIPRKPVHAWTREDMRRLLDATEILRNTAPGTDIAKQDWMRAFILTMYCTGLRLCDAVNHARWSDLEGDVLQVTQKKTGWPVARRLTPQAMQALDWIHEPWAVYLLPWRGNERRLYESFSRVVIAAGIRRGGPKLLRRSAGSHVERMAPGTGGSFLGHRDAAVFDRSYHDRSISAQVPPPPPEI